MAHHIDPLVTFTALEQKLLVDIALDEMNTSNGAEPQSHTEVHCYLWADERASRLGVSEQAIGGLLTSLQKKGAIGVSPQCRQDPDGGIWFTEFGFDVYKTIDQKSL